MKKAFLAAIATCAILAASGQGSAADLADESFSAPTGILVRDDGSILVSEWGAGRVAGIDSNGKRQSVIEGISAPAGIVEDSQGRIYVAGYGNGNIYLWRGEGKPRILATGFSQPTGLLVTSEGNLLVANRGADTVEEIDQSGKRRTISSGHRLPAGLARTSTGALYVSCYGGSVDRVAPDGSVTRITKGLQTPGVGIMPAGPDSVLVVDNGAGEIVEVGPEGKIRSICGNLASPVALARDRQGRILVGTWGDGKIRIVEDGNE